MVNVAMKRRLSGLVLAALFVALADSSALGLKGHKEAVEHEAIPAHQERCHQVMGRLTGCVY
jgi:hypothetical protein